MAVFGARAPLELSLTLFQVLMAFSEKKTAREVFHGLDVDVDLDEFGRIIDDFCDRGLLQREHAGEGADLQHVLNPKIFGDAESIGQVAAWMQQGRAIIIPDALPVSLAEGVYGELQEVKQWTVAEGGHDFFHYRNCVLDKLDDQGAALMECSRLFSSAATRRFIANLAGNDCSGEARVAAAWYRPGEYALPHDDSSTADFRSTAFIWYLTKDWRQEWGGALFWCPTGQYVSPGFNVLIVFRVTPSNIHFICPVAPGATGKRLTINGFWCQAKQGSLPARIARDALVSPRAYGAQAPDALERSPVIVL